MPKEIFIQEYTRKDGTKVRSHYRNIEESANLLAADCYDDALDLINQTLLTIPEEKEALAKLYTEDYLTDDEKSALINQIHLLQSFQNEGLRFQALAGNNLDTNDSVKKIIDMFSQAPTGAAATMNNLNWFEKYKIKALRTFSKKSLPTASHVFMNATNDFSETKKEKHAFIINNLNEIQNDELKNILKNKGVSDNERGAYYLPQSKLAKDIAKTKEVKELIKSNYSELKQGKIIKETSSTYNNSLFNRSKLDNHLAFQKFTIYNLKIVNDVASGIFVDDWGFDELRKDGSFSSELNNKGFEWQEKGALERQFYLIQFEIPITKDFF